MRRNRAKIGPMLDRTRPSSGTLWPIYRLLHNYLVNRYGIDINNARNLSRSTMTQNGNKTEIMLSTLFRSDSDTRKREENKLPISKWYQMKILCYGRAQNNLIISNPENNVLRHSSYTLQKYGQCSHILHTIRASYQLNTARTCRERI